MRSREPFGRRSALTSPVHATAPQPSLSTTSPESATNSAARSRRTAEQQGGFELRTGPALPILRPRVSVAAPSHGAYSRRPSNRGMEPTTTGRFRVLDRRPDGTILLVDLDEAVAAVEDGDPEADLQPLAATPPEADDDLAATVRELEPGYEVTASLAWDDSNARV